MQSQLSELKQQQFVDPQSYQGPDPRLDGLYLHNPPEQLPAVGHTPQVASLYPNPEQVLLQDAKF